MNEKIHKIVIASAVFPPEPVVSALISADLAERLSEKHKVVVLCPPPTRPEGFKHDMRNNTYKYNIIQLQCYTSPTPKIFKRFKESCSFGNHIVKYLKANHNQIDCIYANVWPLFAQIQVVLAAKRYKIPCILHVQDIYPESLTNKLPKLIKFLLRNILLPLDKIIINNSTKVIGISKYMILYLVKSRNVNQDKFELIRNWQDENKFINYLPKNDVDNKAKIFMYLGSISPSADVQTIIKAFHEANISNAKLVIAGSGSDKDNCMKLVNKLNNNQIEFCTITPNKVPELQSKADIFLLPLKAGVSKTATPSKLTSYLLSAKPIIACVENDSDVADILKEADCGIVVEPENYNSLSNGMQQLSNLKRSELQQYGLRGRDYAVHYLSKEHNLNRLISIIENLLHGN
jgi:glycosyltransferase involved in cell wall biosynthesis